MDRQRYAVGLGPMTLLLTSDGLRILRQTLQRLRADEPLDPQHRHAVQQMLTTLLEQAQRRNLKG